MIQEAAIHPTATFSPFFVLPEGSLKFYWMGFLMRFEHPPVSRVHRMDSQAQRPLATCTPVSSRSDSAPAPSLAASSSSPCPPPRCCRANQGSLNAHESDQRENALFLTAKPLESSVGWPAALGRLLAEASHLRGDYFPP